MRPTSSAREPAPGVQRATLLSLGAAHPAVSRGGRGSRRFRASGRGDLFDLSARMSTCAASGRRHARLRRARRPARGSGAPDSEDALVRWAIAALPHRNTLDEAARAALDAAFRARAETLGASPDLILAFAGNEPLRMPPRRLLT